MEMNNRFDHQNQIIDNLSKLVRTLQDTLKVIGKDAWVWFVSNKKIGDCECIFYFKNSIHFLFHQKFAISFLFPFSWSAYKLFIN